MHLVRPSRASRAASTSPARSARGKTLPPASTFVATPSASNRSTTASGPRAARAEWRKRPWSPKASTMPRRSVAWVRLQRVPPERRIFARLRPLFQQERPAAALGRTAGGHQPRRSPAHDDHIPRRHTAIIYEGAVLCEAHEQNEAAIRAPAVRHTTNKARAETQRRRGGKIRGGRVRRRTLARL